MSLFLMLDNDVFEWLTSLYVGKYCLGKRKIIIGSSSYLPGQEAHYK